MFNCASSASKVAADPCGWYVTLVAATMVSPIPQARNNGPMTGVVPGAWPQPPSTSNVMPARGLNSSSARAPSSPVI